MIINWQQASHQHQSWFASSAFHAIATSGVAGVAITTKLIALTLSARSAALTLENRLTTMTLRARSALLTLFERD
jgi:hypothetical protein